MYNKQLEVETTYSRKNIREWVRNDVMSEAVFSDMFIATVEAIDSYRSGSYYASKDNRIAMLPDSEDIAIELFSAVLQLEKNVPIQGVATKLGWSVHSEQLDAVKTGAELLGVCQHTGLYSLLSVDDIENEDITTVVSPNYALSLETTQKIHTTMYLPPMLNSPREWTSNINGGNLLGSGNIVLGAGNDVEQYQCYDVVNKLQDIAWQLDARMLKEYEAPKEEYDLTTLDGAQKQEQHDMRVSQSNQVYKYLLANDNTFFFVWKYDKRGRMYSQGYDVNLQGSEYKKATIKFKKEEVIR